MSQADVAPGRREQIKLQNRQAILDAAREVFSELGYENATVRDIIRRTSLASGTFYNYFRSKEEAHTALADDGARRFAPILKALRAGAQDFESFTRLAVRAYFGFLAQEYEAWAAKHPSSHGHRPIRGETPEMAAVFAEVRQAIEAAVAGGEAPGSDAEYTSAALIAVVREVGEKMLDRRPIDVEGATAFAVAMVLGGLKGLAAA